MHSSRRARRTGNRDRCASRTVVLTQTSVVTPQTSRLSMPRSRSRSIEVGVVECALAGFVDDDLSRSRIERSDDVVPGSPRMRILPIGPGSPMRRLGAPRAIFAGGASDRSGRWPSRVWMTSMPASRAAASIARQGATALCRRDTSLPSVSPKPPGSRKSRCMSMMRSAVRDQASSIAAGSASTRPMLGAIAATSPDPGR